ncbi:MAG: hypothetical protein ACYCSO_03520 [Cuniculiplasma sp.]
MRYLYESGNIIYENEKIATITRSGFGGNMVLNISGKINAQIRRSTLGLLIFDESGRVGRIRKNLNVEISGNEYIVDIKELGDIVSGKETGTEITEDGEVALQLKASKNQVFAEIQTDRHLLLAIVYLALLGYFRKDISRSSSPFSNRNTTFSNILIVVAILVFILFNTKYIGGFYGGLTLTVAILVVAFILRRLPPKMIPKNQK